MRPRKTHSTPAPRATPPASRAVPLLPSPPATPTPPAPAWNPGRFFRGESRLVTAPITASGSAPVILPRSGRVFASLASIPARRAILEQTVASLLPQVDRLGVWLNGYDDVPAFLAHPRIEVRRSQDHGDLGASGKFGWTDEDVGEYRLTCDDDIIYPPDYAARFVHWIERGDRAAVWSLLGFTDPKIENRRFSHSAAYWREAVGSPRPVHWVGSGVMGYHASLKLPLSIFPGIPGRQEEGYVGVWAQQNRIPMYRIPAPADYVKMQPVPSTFAAARAKGDNIEYISKILGLAGGSMTYLAPEWCDPKGYGSFLPLLRWAVDHSVGPVLELGMGHNSTPYLHATGRPIVSLESDPAWTRRFDELRGPLHEIRHVPAWDAAPELDQSWGVVLIDMAPGEARGRALERLARRATWIVCHDTGAHTIDGRPIATDRLYGYEPQLSRFPFRVDDRTASPWTTLVGGLAP